MRVVIVGAGYVGLVTAASLAEAGHNVICVDRDEARVRAVRQGHAPFFEPGLDDLLGRQLTTGRLAAQGNLATAMPGADIVMISVDTPSTPDGIDLRQVLTVAEQIGPLLQTTGRPTTVVVKSTVVPGTTAGPVRDTLDRFSDVPYGLAMNPEFLREGAAVEDALHPDRIVIGQSDATSGTALQQLYGAIACPKIVTTPTTAELIKYATNGLLATLISFANELAAYAERIASVEPEILYEALCLDRRITSNLPSGISRSGLATYLKPGSGFGGSCFPKDVDALRHEMRRVGASALLLDAVAAVNEMRPNAVVGLLEQTIGPLRGQRGAVLGLAFKPDTNDVRRSPALALIAELRRRGAEVNAYDPIATESARAALRAQAVDGVKFADTPEEALRAADFGVIGTAWPQFRELDWGTIIGTMTRAVVLDARGGLAGRNLPPELLVIPVGTQPISLEIANQSTAVGVVGQS